MEYHPDYTEKCRNLVNECPHFESEREATEMANEMKKEHPDGLFRVWASLEKDEEFYRINAPWIVTTNGEQMKAAEYIGMLSTYDILVLT